MREYFEAPNVYERILRVADQEIRPKRPELRSIGISNPATHPPKWIWLGVSVENQEYADKRIPFLLQTPAAKRFVSYEPALGPVDFSSINLREHVLAELGSHAIRWRNNPNYPEHIPLNCLTGWNPGGDKLGHLDWVIVGGESGPGARPFNIAWAGSVVQQCKAAGVACFVKQMGSKPQTRNDQVADVWYYADGSDMDTVEGPRHPEYQYQGGTVTLKLKSSKGGDMEEWPAELRVREFPHMDASGPRHEA